MTIILQSMAKDVGKKDGRDVVKIIVISRCNSISLIYRCQ
jgi:hypothetical protein